MAMSLSTKDGFPTQAVHGFFKAMGHYAEQFPVTQVAVAWDGKHSSARRELFPAYKAGREAQRKVDPKMEAKWQESKKQIPVIRAMCCALGWTQIDGTEADDAIAIVAQKAAMAGIQSVIVSSDKDFYQLVGEHISIYNPMQGAQVRHITISNFEAVKGMRPDQWLDFRAMMGDASDGIPGAKGVGEKTARGIIATFGSAERFALMCRNGHKPDRFQKKLLDGWDDFMLSRQLMDLRLDNILNHDDFNVHEGACDLELFKEALVKFEMLELYSQVESWVQAFGKEAA
jgi:DNA polymerase-1